MTVKPTPGRPSWRSGVLASGLLAALLAGLPACDVIERRETLVLDTAQVTLASGARIHDVELRGAGGTDSIAPTEVRARPGDVVRFATTDHRTHSIAFQAEALSPQALEWLDRSDQRRGPPLVNQGASWIVSLEDAPPGRYPFVCLNHGAAGTLLVDARE